MLEFNRITFQYPDANELLYDGVSFQIEQGTFVSFVGVSGCGKSTIFRLLNGLVQPQGGSILLNGKPIKKGEHFAFMPQKDLLFPWRNIRENVSLPLELKKVPKKERLEKADEMLERVGLADYRKSYPKDLSGGMRQRVSFVRTLLSGEDILLLDEPFSALDSLTRISMQEWLLEQFQNFQKTILLVTHDVEEALFLSQKIFVFQNKPVTKLIEKDVPMMYPRNRLNLERNEILELKKEIIKELKEVITI